MEPQDRRVYEFGPFRLEAARRRLLRAGQPVPLTVQVFDLLLLLLQNEGQLVEKEELMKRIWPGAVVEENNLTVRVSMLRKALGESRGSHKYIETVPRRGYRFVARVRVVSEAGRAPAEEQGAQVAAGAKENGRGEAINSLAVLPFANLSDNTDAEYLSEGITENIIGSLSQLPGLRVMARSTVFRYQGPNVDALEVGRRLKVGAVLVGRVFEVSERLAVSVELVNVADGTQIWGGHFRCELAHIFAVQGEIAREITDKLRLKLSVEAKQRLAKRYTENVDAYYLYVKGRHFWNKYSKESLRESLDCFRQAIALDPGYALAYAGLADTYCRLSSLFLPPREAFAQARAAALQSVALDSELAEGHAALGMVRLYYEHDFAAAESEYELAARLSPGSALVHLRYGSFLMYVGRFSAALASFKLALEGDPLSPSVRTNLATCYYLQARYTQAIAQAEEVRALEPAHFPICYALGWIHARRGDFTAALAEAQRLVPYHSLEPTVSGLVGYVYAVSGRQHEAKRVIKELTEAAKSRYVSPYQIARIYAGLGEKEQVFAWLERAYQERDDWLVWLGVAPELDPLRSDERLTALLERIGLA